MWRNIYTHARAHTHTDCLSIHTIKYIPALSVKKCKFKQVSIDKYARHTFLAPANTSVIMEAFTEETARMRGSWSIDWR